MTNVPDTMRALQSAEGGAPVSALRVVDDRPTPRAGTASSAPASLKPVLVKVERAAVQFVDTMLLSGHFWGKMEWPYVVGVDFAGTIAEVSDGSKWKVGDRVWGCTALGYGGAAHLQSTAPRLKISWALSRPMCRWSRPCRSVARA